MARRAPTPAWPNGSTGQWRKTRKRVLERDGHLCQLRLTDRCTRHATEVHHRGGREHTGDHQLHLLVSACRSCNLTLRHHPELDTAGADPSPRPSTRW